MNNKKLSKLFVNRYVSIFEKGANGDGVRDCFNIIDRKYVVRGRYLLGMFTLLAFFLFGAYKLFCLINSLQ